MANVDVDEALLQRIAGATGGKFFRATDAQGLADTFADDRPAREERDQDGDLHALPRGLPARRRSPRPALLAAAGLLAAFAFPVVPR